MNANINLEKVKFEKLNESSQAGFFELERRINVLYKRDPIIDLFKKNNRSNFPLNLIKQKINNLIPKFLMKNIELRLEKKIDKFCKNDFSLNNLKLQKELKINLKKYGYKL